VTTVNVIGADGSGPTGVDGADGDAVMVTARTAGIVGECGGVLSCSASPKVATASERTVSAAR
jgi:hypothetical protein